MSVKHVLLIALVLVNLLLVAALVIQVTSPKSAEAQVAGGGNAYLAVTAVLPIGEDSLWILDLKTRKLHVMRQPAGADKVMQVIWSRDLQRDMRGAVASPVAGRERFADDFDALTPGDQPMTEQGKTITIAVLFVTAVLLVCTLLIVDRMPVSSAYAGGPDRGGDYIMVAGANTVRLGEVVYVIDMAARKLVSYTVFANRIEVRSIFNLETLPN